MVSVVCLLRIHWRSSMIRNQRHSPLLFAAAGALGLAGVASCGDLESDVGSVEGAVLGDQLAGLPAGEFAAARDNFATFEGAPDGLGPIFNERACGACHTDG